MHPALALARFGKRRTADLFVGFWLALLVEAQQLRPNVRGAARHAEKFLTGRDVRAAVDEAGTDVAKAAALILDAGLDERLIGLLVHGYLEAVAPHGANELREAAQRHPKAQARLESALEA